VSSTARLILVLLAAVLAGLAAADPVGIPEWAQVAIAALSAALAGFGIVPPQYPHPAAPPPPNQPAP
jgi:hypothetical protein